MTAAFSEPFQLLPVTPFCILVAKNCSACSPRSGQVRSCLLSCLASDGQVQQEFLDHHAPFIIIAGKATTKKHVHYYILDWLINLMGSYSITVKIIFIYFNNTWFIHLCTEVIKNLGWIQLGFFRIVAPSSQSHSLTLYHVPHFLRILPNRNA